MATATRPFQVVVWGASGFVGQLVCERLATEYPNQLRVALAGRDRRKLENVRTQMAKYDPSWKEMDLMVAGSSDRLAIDAITKSTEVVISCAGPYRKYSSEMVASSVANGSHYLDLTAELPWIRSNIRKYHDTALQNETKIVHFCGFDSVPMDLGSLLVVQAIRDRYQTGCRRVEQFYVDGFGGVSGGTAASGADLYASASNDERIAMKDPYCLTPQYLKQGSGRILVRDEDINIPVVQRSNALAAEPYGKDFVYREGIKVPNLLAAWMTDFVGTLFGVVTEYSFLQGLFEMTAPKPGTGPSLDVQREKGFWRVMFVGYPEDPNAKIVYAKMEDNHGDPGYWSTSKMLVECALSLILDKEKVDRAAALKGGVLTPALAFGCVPLERLKTRGVFVVDVLP